MSRITSVVASAVQAAGNLVTNLRRKPEEAVAEPRDLVAPATGETPEKEWTVLVYLDGRERLAYSTVQAMKAMESVGSSDQVNIVAQATVEPTPAERLYADVRPSTTRRYYVKADGARCVGDLRETKALDPQGLSDFLSWGVKSFPAKRYMVVVKKHGLGFAKSEPAAPLSAREMDEALKRVVSETGRKVDVVSFDSCAMQQMEVAYQLKDDARVMVGSQEDVFAIDYPYAKVLGDLKAQAATAEAADVGRIIVGAHRDLVKRGMQSAVDLDKVQSAGAAIKSLVDAIVEEKVPREVVYTNMLETSSMEPQESMRLAFDFRDLRGFLQNLARDPEVKSDRVREAARQAEGAVAATVIDSAIHDSKKKIKNAQGLTAFVPWKSPTESMHEGYGQLAWDRDTSWMRLVDYVFDGTAPAESSDSKVATADLSLTQRLGKAAIRQYKQYISPHLLVSCRYDPSCSQYTREAIEKHGLIQGSKIGFMRLVSCSGHGDRHDPVPEAGETPAQAATLHPRPETFIQAPRVLLQPPPRVEKSARRRGIEHRLIAATRMAGRMVGGLCGAAACLAPGLAFGAVMGWKAGRATIDQLNRDLLKTYRRESVAKLVDLEHIMGDPGFAVYNKVKSLTGSAAVAGAVGAVAGGIAGGLMGSLGGLYKGYRWGALFGGLWSANVLKDRLGELPRHPVTEAILRHDYDVPVEQRAS